MLIGYAMPDPTSIALSGGDAVWLTSGGGEACCDGKPARRARAMWRSDAIPDITQTVSITLTIALTPVRVLAMLGLASVPAGVVFAVFGKRTGDDGTTYDFGGGNTAAVVQFADGSFGAWFVVPAAADPVEQVEFRIYNNVAGATWAELGTAIDIGELVAMPAVDIKIDAGWTSTRIDPSEVTRTRGAQVNAVALTPYREMAVTFSMDSEANVRFGGLANGMDWERLASALAGAVRCVAIPRWETLVGSGVVSAAKLNESAIYAVASFAETTHLRGPFWNKQATFAEVPA